MVLPFVAVFTKPFFCALADRHRRYRLYFILALLFTLLGFGSYALLPFFPHFIAAHGRASWHLLVAATIVGYIAYGVVWSLGDAYAANVSHRTGESFGMIRLWGTVGWGAAGACVGLVSPHVELPEMVLGFLIFIGTHLFEILLLIWWPNGQDFEMGETGLAANERPPAGPATMTEKPAQAGAGPKRAEGGQPECVAISLVSERPGSGSDSDSGLGSARICGAHSNSTLAILPLAKLHSGAAKELEARLGQLAAEERPQVGHLQTTIFKMVAARHKSLVKYLILFVALGAVYNIHWSYFFLHLDQLASEGKGADFSTLVGLCLVAQAVGETFCFAIAPRVVNLLGRDGAISLNAITYALRYFGNGLGIPLLSPYVAILTESLQGINYGIFYYLITDTALHYALLVDELIPELQARGLLAEGADLGAVRTSLRATMQGVFSGAFDGLGFGLGSLIAGLVLERHSYEQLWCYAGAAAVAIFLLHGIYELANRALRRRLSRTRSYKREIERINRALE